MARSTALVIAAISVLLPGLARVNGAELLYGVQTSFSSLSTDREVFPPPLDCTSNIGSAASPIESIEGDLIKSVFVDTRDGIALGIGANYFTRPESDPVTGLIPANARALAATAFTVQGVSSDPIPASIELSGTFQGDTFFDIRSRAYIQLRVYEFDPNDPAGFDPGNAVGMDVSVDIIPVGEDIQLAVQFVKFRRTTDSPFDELLGEGEWTGSETLDFDLPASGKGIFIELWGASEIVPIDGDPEGAGFDFLNTATLDINPPPGTTVTLATGQVFGAEPPPCPSIAEILAFYDASVADGTLVGNGRGNSADGRLKALRNMIESVDDLIEEGELELAYVQLWDAYDRCDGESRPPDFVAGPAAPVLNSLLFALLTCED